jgi:N-acetylglutamate synthase-like GNAT family acetyltransferase
MSVFPAHIIPQAPAAPEPWSPDVARLADEEIAIRAGGPDDAEAIHALVTAHVAEGHLLPRSLDEIAAHAHRFVVAEHGGEIVGCADLAPLSRSVAEVRSLIVRREVRAMGLGRRLVEALTRRASLAGFEKVCAFTHAPGCFVRMGFSLVPHVWLPEKIEHDCRGCAQFRRCGQYAVMLSLTRTRHACVPLASLHG